MLNVIIIGDKVTFMTLCYKAQWTVRLNVEHFVGNSCSKKKKDPSRITLSQGIETYPFFQKSVNRRSIENNPFLRIPDNKNQTGNPFFHIPDNTNQAGNPFLYIPDNKNQSTNLFSQIPDSKTRSGNPFLQILDNKNQPGNASIDQTRKNINLNIIFNSNNPFLFNFTNPRINTETTSTAPITQAPHKSTYAPELVTPTSLTSLPTTDRSHLIISPIKVEPPTSSGPLLSSFQIGPVKTISEQSK